MKKPSALSTVGRNGRPGFWLLGILLAASASSACRGGGGAPPSPNDPGDLLDHPGSSGTLSKKFVVDENEQGAANSLRMHQLFWGRLVNVFDEDADGVRILQHVDYVIAGDIESEPGTYLLETNPVTAQVSLTILHDSDSEDAAERQAYLDAFRELDRNVRPIFDEGLEGSGFFSPVPRNAAIVIPLNDLLDPKLVSRETVHVLTGTPPDVPFEGRIFADPNHGDTYEGTFFSTRIVIDTTVSELEAFLSNPPLAVNGVGFPPSTSTSMANVVLRLPTAEDPSIGQDRILRNRTGHKLATSQNGSVDFSSPTVDVVRAMRSGGSQLVTGDPFNGFLKDEVPPEIVGRQPINIETTPVPDPDGVDDRDLILPEIMFLSEFCSTTPTPGDVIQQSSFFAEVREVALPPSSKVVFDIKVRLVLGDPADWTALGAGVGAASFLSVYDPVVDASSEACFIQVAPQADGFPELPAVGLATASRMTVRFSEPMDPASLTAFDSLVLTRVADFVSTDQFVVGTVLQSQDLQSFEFVPDLPLRHIVGESEPYYLALTGGALGPVDLAGNAPTFAFPQIELTIDPTATSQSNGGRVSRFTSPDEEFPFGDDVGLKPEWSGQHLYDLTRQLIRPRPLIRFEAVADRTQRIPSLHTPFPPGVQTPLSNLGSKMQTVWRYADVGFTLTDASNFDVDVEGLNWSPIGGFVIADNYNEFEIRLSHSAFLPDEYINTMSLFPQFPNSGLKRTFSTNLLDPARDPQRVVHPRFKGYIVAPGDLFAASTGTLMMPFPLNRDVPISDYVFYTWRDTAIPTRGGVGSGGVELWNNCLVLGIGSCEVQSAGRVQTIGLPLLMEFRCYPDDEALGLNAFDISLAANSSARPDFRAFSTGGVDTTGTPQSVDPDLEIEANGGYNPASSPPGATTWGLDNTFYIGAMDLVTRISRSYSLWFEATGLGGSGNQVYNPAVVEPRPESQPNGTQVLIAYRGASAIELSDAQREDFTGPSYNASELDGYGDWYENPVTDRNLPNTIITFVGDAEWKSDVSRIDGAQYYQMRLTFLSNPETAVSPEISAVGLTWFDPTP